MTRQDFISEINTYVNGAIFSKADLFGSLLYPKKPFKKHADRLIRKFRDFQMDTAQKTVSEMSVDIEPYRGKNQHVHKMIDYLEKRLKQDLYGAYVHGSLGTNEEIPYSDFDALIIIKDDSFSKSERLSQVAYKLNKARSIMFDFDPLQHHGWFVLTESHLRTFPDDFFPPELLHYAKSLFKDRGLTLFIRKTNSSEGSLGSFQNFSNTLLKRLKDNNSPKNMYELKALLSQFMLVPALYVQVRDKRGIFKKQSFDEARRDFTEEEWSIMDDVSLIREKWSDKISPLRRMLFRSFRQVSRFLARKYAPIIPSKIQSILSFEFYQRMINLITAMQNKIR